MSPKDAGFHRNPSDAKVTQVVELMDLSVPMESGKIQRIRPATDPYLPQKSTGWQIGTTGCLQ